MLASDLALSETDREFASVVAPRVVHWHARTPRSGRRELELYGVQCPIMVLSDGYDSLADGDTLVVDNATVTIVGHLETNDVCDVLEVDAAGIGTP